MKLNDKNLRKLIKENMKEMSEDTVKVGRSMMGSVIELNGDPVSSEDLADAFEEKGQSLLEKALSRESGGSVDQDAFIEYYLRPAFKMNTEEIARKYADSIGAKFSEEDDDEYDEEY